MLTLQVKEQIIENLTPDEKFIRGTVGAKCQIKFDEFWSKYEKTVVFQRKCQKPINIIVNELDNEIEIPYEILEKHGKFKIGVFGIIENEVLPTLWSTDIEILCGTDTHGTAPHPYTPNEIDQLRLSKQDKLTAGDGISISEDNVISAIGGSGAVDDVQVNGESVVDEGVANIPIDQTYNANSLNAQSGKAVAEAVSTKIPKVAEYDVESYPKAVVSISDLEMIDGKLYPKDTAYKHLNIDNGYSKSFSVSSTKGFIAARDSETGNLWTGEPVDDVDCVNKKYVDDIVGNIETLLGGI